MHFLRLTPIFAQTTMGTIVYSYHFADVAAAQGVRGTRSLRGSGAGRGPIKEAVSLR